MGEGKHLLLISGEVNGEEFKVLFNTGDEGEEDDDDDDDADDDDGDDDDEEEEDDKAGEASPTGFKVDKTERRFNLFIKEGLGHLPASFPANG